MYYIRKYNFTTKEISKFADLPDEFTTKEELILFLAKNKDRVLFQMENDKFKRFNSFDYKLKRVTDYYTNESYLTDGNKFNQYMWCAKIFSDDTGRLTLVDEKQIFDELHPLEFKKPKIKDWYETHPWIHENKYFHTTRCKK